MTRHLCTSAPKPGLVLALRIQRQWYRFIWRMLWAYYVLSVVIVGVQLHHGKWMLVAAPICSMMSTTVAVVVSMKRVRRNLSEREKAGWAREDITQAGSPT